ncbi:hypothetical protein CEXT_112461 [Caerostris extrusa]|uniref:Uncharacterized protein n=1 Tax=Caerostris extrusa TaxID=172846 RepID=A0AAV4W5L0_CAEEX|nr:hypothetical protein CEXT_112461 [Caerostris extrusa]
MAQNSARHRSDAPRGLLAAISDVSRKYISINANTALANFPPSWLSGCGSALFLSRDIRRTKRPFWKRKACPYVVMDWVMESRFRWKISYGTLYGINYGSMAISTRMVCNLRLMCL